MYIHIICTCIHECIQKARRGKRIDIHACIYKFMCDLMYILRGSIQSVTDCQGNRTLAYTYSFKYLCVHIDIYTQGFYKFVCVYKLQVCICIREHCICIHKNSRSIGAKGILYTYVYTYLCICIHICILYPHVCVCLYIMCNCICIRAYIYIHIHNVFIHLSAYMYFQFVENMHLHT